MLCASPTLDGRQTILINTQHIKLVVVFKKNLILIVNPVGLQLLNVFIWFTQALTNEDYLYCITFAVGWLSCPHVVSVSSLEVVIRNQVKLLRNVLYITFKVNKHFYFCSSCRNISTPLTFLFALVNDLWPISDWKFLTEIDGYESQWNYECK